MQRRFLLKKKNEYTPYIDCFLQRYLVICYGADDVLVEREAIYLRGKKMIRIVTDSSADISAEEASAKGITVLPLTINFGKDQYRDGADITALEFYKKLEESKVVPTTSQASPMQYEELFSLAREQGDTLIVLPISRKLSGSYQCATMVKKQGNYDNVYIVDTLSTVGKLRMLVLEALKLKDDMSAEQLVKHLEDLRDRTTLIALVDTLEYLFKGGRLSRTSAVIGTVLNIKPLITIDKGEIKVIGKCMGVRKAVDSLSQYLKEADVDKNYPLIFGYSPSVDRVMKLIDKCVEQDRRQYYYDNLQVLSAIVGVHIGPGAAYLVYVENK